MAASSEIPDREKLKCESSNKQGDNLQQRILGTIYGQCAGDALGLLTEFLTKNEAKKHYQSVSSQLEYEHKAILNDAHRCRWKIGDWTDDTDQMILILLSIIENNGKVDALDFAKRITRWTNRGYIELGDYVGMGIGSNTFKVVRSPNFLQHPHAAASLVWNDDTQRLVASNGAVMRTSILGVHNYSDLVAVKQNALNIGTTTHADTRCQASVVSVSVAIAMMLQRLPRHLEENGEYNVKNIIADTYVLASECLETPKEKKKLLAYLNCEKLKTLKLDEDPIGYTYKSMGCGFWALKQNNFREAIQKVVMKGGDADTNTCVAGAMLGCKLGCDAIPDTWKDKLLHKDWLDNIIQRYFKLLAESPDDGS